MSRLAVLLLVLALPGMASAQIEDDDPPSGIEDDDPPSGIEDDDPPSGIEDDPSGIEDDEPSGIEDDEPSGIEDDEPSGIEDDEPSGIEDDEPSGIEGDEGASAPDADQGAPAAPVLTPPRLIEAPEVELPPDVEPPPPGSGVTVAILITAEGTVGEVEVLEPLREDLDVLLTDSVRQMRFEPATRDGVAIEARIRFRVGFPEPEPEPDPVSEPADGTPQEGEGLPAGEGTDAEGEVDPDASPEFDTEFEDEDLEFGATSEVDRPEPGAATRITLEAEELTTVPGTFGEPLRVVATLPGVARSPFGLGFFLVRGASFQNTGFLIDGYRVPILYHLGFGPSVISSRLVSKLDFYPGGYPSRLARFTAGVVSVETAPPPSDRLHLELEVDLLKASVMAVVPFDEGRGTIAAAYRRSYYEFLVPLIVEGVNISFQDYQIRGDYRFSDALEASVFFFGSSDSFDNTQTVEEGSVESASSQGLDYDWQRLITSLTLRLPNQLRVKWSGMLGNEATGFRTSQPGQSDVRFLIDGTYFGTRLEATWPWHEQLETNVGVDVSATRYELNLAIPTVPGLGVYPQPRFTANGVSEFASGATFISVGLWAQQLLRLGELELTAGVRGEYLEHARFQGWVADPRFVGRLSLGDDLVIKASVGLFHQPPQPFNILREVGNQELPPERSLQTSAGIELDLPLDLDVQATGFYTQMWAIARTVNQLELDDDGTVRRNFYQADGEGRSFGLELMVRRKIDKGLYGWLSYTLAWSERFLPEGDVVPFIFDQRHTLNIALSYAIDGWRFGARFQLSSGRPDRPVLGTVYDADTGRYRAERGGFTERLPVYHQLDIRVDRDITLGPFTGSVYLDILNVYYAQNSEGVSWQYDFQDNNQLPGIPILGTLGIRLEYE